MNKKLIALLLVLLVLMSGCKGKNDTPAEVTNAPVEVTEERVPTETLHPALADNPFDDESAESAETTELNETEASANTEPSSPTEDPTQPSEEPTEAPEDDGKMDYEEYMSLSAQAQNDYMNSFESVDAFFAWYNSVKAEYDSQKSDIEVGNGSFDLGELEGNN